MLSVSAVLLCLFLLNDDNFASGVKDGDKIDRSEATKSLESSLNRKGV